MFRVERMQSEDFKFAEELTDIVEWGFVREDFEFMTRLEPEGCFILYHDNERVGLATTIAYEKLGWFGNLIVKEQFRKKGGGAMLVKHAIGYLASKGVTAVGLYAYTERIPFYQSLGFIQGINYTGQSTEELNSSRLTERVEVDEGSRSDLEDIIEFDRQCFGDSRKRLLNAIMNIPRNICYVKRGKNSIEGYIMAKVYKGFTEVGPLVCRKSRKNIELSLLEAVFCEIEGFNTSITVPKIEGHVLDYVRVCGFAEKFPVVRMFFNMPPVTDCITIPESLERG